MENFDKFQNRIFDRAARGESLLVNGAAGVGKTSVLKHLDENLYNRGVQRHVLLNASPGIASITIDCQTISRRLMLGIYDYTDRQIRERNRDVRFPGNTTLVVDEYATLDYERIRQIDVAMQTVMYSQRPFGGAQVIFLGDECQIRSLKRRPAEEYPFIAALPRIELKHSYRHENDREFLHFLTQMRTAIQWEQEIDVSQWWKNVLPRMTQVDDSEDLIITPYFHQAQKINDEKMASLAYGEKSGTLCSYRYGPAPPEPSYVELLLCVGAPVVHTLNRNGLVNGSLGVVIDIDDSAKNERVFARFENGMEQWVGLEIVKSTDEKSSSEYVPLLPAFALSARKVQGLTLTHGTVSDDFLYIDGEEGDQVRRLYTAMSRFTHLDKISMCSYVPRMQSRNSILK